MSREKRKYEMKQRAAEMAETHVRITEAAIELHGTVGPARTTLSAVAKQAGVERRTLYRHFPSEAELFEACSTHYFAATRSRSGRLAGPQHALDELYAYYEQTAPMLATCSATPSWSSSPATPSHRCTRISTRRPTVLLDGRRGRLPRRWRVRHALAFSTWRSLNSVKRSDAIKLVTALVERAG